MKPLFKFSVSVFHFLKPGLNMFSWCEWGARLNTGLTLERILSTTTLSGLRAGWPIANPCRLKGWFSSQLNLS